MNDSNISFDQNVRQLASCYKIDFYKTKLSCDYIYSEKF